MTHDEIASLVPGDVIAGVVSMQSSYEFKGTFLFFSGSHSTASTRALTDAHNAPVYLTTAFWTIIARRHPHALVSRRDAQTTQDSGG